MCRCWKVGLKNMPFLSYLKFLCAEFSISSMVPYRMSLKQCILIFLLKKKCWQIYILRVLFTARASPGIPDLMDRTPIYLAAERGHTGCVDFLADKFKVKNYFICPWSSLTATYVLFQKASVFDRAKDGSTLLHVASLNGHADTAIVLYRRGVPLLMPNR